jgi:hypothetical protein
MPNVPPSPNVDHSYPLSTLFLLTAACASVLALVTPLVRGRVGEEIGLEAFAVSVIVGGITLGVVGALLGLFHYRRLFSSSVGLMIGIMLGTLVGPLGFVPTEDFSYVLLSAGGGSLVMLGLATVVRLRGDGWHKGDLLGRATIPRQPKRHPLDPDPEDEPANEAVEGMQDGEKL